MRSRKIQTRRLVISAALLVVAGLVVRMLGGAHTELKRADRAPSQQAQIRHLRRAMAYYLPFNPWVRQAKERLLILARSARSRGDRDVALDAFRELRSAILSLRGISQPFAESLPELNQAIAQLASADPRAAKGLKTSSGKARLLHRLEHPRDPSPGWAALGTVGFLLWVGSAIALFLRGVKPDLALVGQRFWPLSASVALGLALFCLGMALA